MYYVKLKWIADEGIIYCTQILPVTGNQACFQYVKSLALFYIVMYYIFTISKMSLTTYQIKKPFIYFCMYIKELFCVPYLETYFIHTINFSPQHAIDMESK